ncbi:MAG: nucleotidyltransferase [Bacteroidetes bacterium]|jgi:NDP-sugar pyrophosphorylase family protein|nr:nucleotidyltransferase [Bacteroidota bacterium]MBS1979710.1 nucleotidyltransferase [Bacteroidota bacterium]
MAADKRLSLLVLAAGMGSRYGGIKQIDGFGPSGETIMDYSLFDALRAGFNKIVFIVREEIRSTVEEMFLPKLQGKADVVFVNQELNSFVPQPFQNPQRTKPWGTSHAMLCAQDVINEPFAVINADDFYGLDAFAATAEFFKHEPSAHAMVGYTLKNVLSDHGSVSRGCGERDEQGFLKSVVERTTIVKENGKIIAKEKTGDLIMDPETPTSMNFWGFHPSIMPLTENYFHEFLKNNHQNIKSEFFIPLTVNEMIKTGKGKVKVISGGNTWFGVTYKEDKEIVSAKINELVNQGKYPKKLW